MLTCFICLLLLLFLILQERSLVVIQGISHTWGHSGPHPWAQCATITTSLLHQQLHSGLGHILYTLVLQGWAKVWIWELDLFECELELDTNHRILIWNLKKNDRKKNFLNWISLKIIWIFLFKKQLKNGVPQNFLNYLIYIYW